MKARRRAAILRILRERAIETQQELAAALREEGFPVTQATVSRDVAELGLVKRMGEDGRYRWEAPAGLPPGESLARARRAFADYVTGVDYSGNLVVVRTVPGAAQAVAVTLDGLGWPEILATVAGDDTILVVTAEERREEREDGSRPAAALARRLRSLLE